MNATLSVSDEATQNSSALSTLLPLLLHWNQMISPSLQRTFLLAFLCVCLIQFIYHVEHELSQLNNEMSQMKLRKNVERSETSETESSLLSIEPSIGLRNRSSEIKIPDDYDPSFESPGWSCSDQSITSGSPNHKLIFVHVFKTAGSSFRSFFRDYGMQCKKGVATIISCSNVSSQSMYFSDPDEPWVPDCTVKELLNRSRKVIQKQTQMKLSHLQQHADVAIGHFPYGLHSNWKNTLTDEFIKPQYVTFFREPYSKYISGRLFVHEKKKWTFDEAVSEIKRGIHEQKKEGIYNGYKKYLLTPEQREEGLKKNISEQKWVDIMKQNILDTHSIVGVIEEMPGSISLIQSVIDVDKTLTAKLNGLVYPESSKNKIAKNQSTLSTSKVVAKLKEDEETWIILTEILTYEFQLYDFAVKVHDLQVEALKQNHGDLFSFDSPI